MNCCDVLYLLLHIAHGILITVVCMLRELVHLVLPRRLKSVKGEIVLVSFYNALTSGAWRKCTDMFQNTATRNIA
jgi:hypothetical protein